MSRTRRHTPTPKPPKPPTPSSPSSTPPEHSVLVATRQQAAARVLSALPKPSEVAREAVDAYLAGAAEWDSLLVGPLRGLVDDEVSPFWLIAEAVRRRREAAEAAGLQLPTTPDWEALGVDSTRDDDTEAAYLLGFAVGARLGTRRRIDPD